jgi:DNA helicase-2/ATP-dependent DNA helicase PcrA
LKAAFELNPQQQAAATWEGGHVLVLAGAGPGKPRTIIARAAHLMAAGVDPGRILLLTFTRRAAREMVQRLSQLTGQEKIPLMAGTFHHFCLYTMRRMPRDFGIQDATVIDRDDQVQLMKLVRGTYRKKGEQLPRASELVSLCSYARNTNQPMADYLKKHTDFDEATIEKMRLMARDYDRRKRLNHYLDYDDILFLFARRLNEDDTLRKRLKGFYDHILVDEMQDTNPLQWLILDVLRDPARLFCVGDDAQSIYAFRGADFRNVHAFAERVPDATVLRLEKNYRSTQGILDLSNWLLKTSPLKYGKQLLAVRRAVSRPRLLDFENDFEEARWIAHDLIERHEGGAAWADQMIITRTSYGARSLESFMVEKKIPYRFIGGVSLLQAAHVKDLLSLIRACFSLRDELAWARYLTLWPRIGDATAARLIKELKPLYDIQDALKMFKKRLKGRQDVFEGITTVVETWNDPPTTIMKAGHYLEPMLKTRYTNWKNRRRDFDLLARLAKRHRSLMAFLETYTLDPVSVTESQRLEEDDVVTLTTVHGAKGTEALVCYLIRVEPGMYPHLRSLGRQEDEEEERRILYVAMTRAKDELILTRSLRWGNTRRSPYSASVTPDRQREAYFFRELDDDLVDSDYIYPEFDDFTDFDFIVPRRN